MCIRDRKKPGGLLFEQGRSPGGSAQTWTGLMEYMHIFRPDIVFYENVSEIDTPDKKGIDPDKKSNKEVLIQQWGGINYEAITVEEGATCSPYFWISRSPKALHCRGCQYRRHIGAPNLSRA